MSLIDGVQAEKAMLIEDLIQKTFTGEVELQEKRAGYQCSGCNTYFEDYIAFIYPDINKWPRYCPECGRRFKEANHAE